MIEPRQHAVEFQDALGNAYDVHDMLNRPPAPEQQLQTMLYWQREIGDKLSPPAAQQLQESIGSLQELLFHHPPG